MAFDYLEFWSCEDSQTTEQQNKKFKDSIKGEVIQKPLLTNSVLIVGNNKREVRQRPNDLNNFFVKREFETLKQIKPKN